MADDRDARIAELEAELRQARDENAALRTRESALVGDVAYRDRALGEALEQQTATAEVLRVIASSPDRLPARPGRYWESAARLCDASDGDRACATVIRSGSPAEVGAPAASDGESARPRPLRIPVRPSPCAA